MLKFLEKFLEQLPINLSSPNTKTKNWLKLFPRILEIQRIWHHFQELLKFLDKFLERHPNLCSPNIKSKFNTKIFDRYRISLIPRIWRHFQELLKFFEKFLERPPINLCSPNTKSNFWQKFSLKNFDNSLKNFSNNFLSTYILLIKNREINKTHNNYKKDN